VGLPNKCPLCNAGRESQSVVTSHVYGRKGNDHAFFYCNSCDVRYQFPTLSSDEEANFYAAEFEGFMACRSGENGGWHKAEEHIISNEMTRQRRMKYLIRHLTAGSSLLEIGCSSGFMLFPFAKQGYVCTGIEPSGVFSEFVKSKGLTVYDSLTQVEVSALQSEFDFILHFFVLEHIADPLAFLQTQVSLLKSGGKIIFEIPNAADPLYSVYDVPAFERFYWSVAHPWYFSENSLHYLLQQLKQPYEILRDQRYDLSNHMVWARDGKPGGIGRFTDTLGLEMEESYKKALIRSGRCDTLVGIISKK